MGVPQPHTLFVPVSPGLESLLFQEIRKIGGIRPKALSGGVEYEANDHILYRSLLEIGLGLDVRLRLGRFTVRYLDAIVRMVAELPWSHWLGAGQHVEIRATSRRSKVMHTTAIEERVHSGIRRAVGSLASENSEPWRVFARMERDQLEVSLSMAGLPLHQRGYRLASGKAPLREDLALALLSLSKWSAGSPLVDTFCGSGTILIEAARKARGIPPGWDRTFHVERAPIFDPTRWNSIRDRLRLHMAEEGAVGQFWGSDRDAGAIESARSNAERAGVLPDLSLAVAPVGQAPCFHQLRETPSGWWISNPPYGDRVRGGNLRPLFQTIGRLFTELPPGFHLGLLVEDAALAHNTGVSLQSRLMLDHGGKKVRLYCS